MEHQTVAVVLHDYVVRTSTASGEAMTPVAARDEQEEKNEQTQVPHVPKLFFFAVERSPQAAKIS